MAAEDRVSDFQDERVLEIEGGEGCTTMYITNATELFT